jgi:UDP-N-acetylglucosamine--N-acetylmuramyl-(pentapeptide) pyrophosphoryl-undecaprenol N-acetylglucosamine transferase
MSNPLGYSERKIREDDVDYKYSVAVACGGTGGHIFPGLATARALLDRGHDVTLWLAGKHMEQSAVAGWDGASVTIPSEGAQRVIRSVFRSCSMMRHQKPEVVLAMGGFGSVGPCLAARLLGIPYVLHEANAVPGKAVRFLSRGAATVALHFEDAREKVHCQKIVYTGMPVRPEILSVARKYETEDFSLLVLGGSGGSHAINETVSAAVCKLSGRNLKVTHLTGSDDAPAVARRYADAEIHAEVRPFELDMAKLYAEADFVICRAGASTCAETAALDIPALFIPLPSAADDHQLANARSFAATGRMGFVRESDCSVTWLTCFLQHQIKQPKRPASRRDREAGTVEPAAEKLAGLVEACARKAN